MNVIIVGPPLPTRIPHSKARKKLTACALRGTRLVRDLQDAEQNQSHAAEMNRLHTWYVACARAADGIYPTKGEHDHLHKAYTSSGKASDRAQRVVDVLEDLVLTVGDYSDQPRQARLVDWLREQRGFSRFLNAVWLLAAYGLGEFREEIFAWGQAVLGFGGGP
jgi:hypothetical protein